MAWFDQSEMKNRVRALVALVLVPLLLASSRQAPRAIAFSLAYGTGRTLDVFLQRDTPFGGFLVQTGQLTLELRPLDSTQRSYSLAANAPGRISAAGVPCPGAVSIGMACFPERNVVKVPFLLPDSLKSGMYTAKLIARGSAAHETDGSPLPVGRAIYPSLIYVPSVTNDVALIQARQRYLRKTVYAVAGSAFQPYETRCIDDARGDGRLNDYQSATIVSVDRSNGAAEQRFFQDTDSDFVALDPLIVRLVPGPSNAGSNCGDRVIPLADPWEMERRFALHDPRRHPEWSERFRQALAQRNVLSGMTHEMVASVFGYPAHYGTVAQLDLLDVWRYDSPTPFSSTVYFAGDRVVRWDPPGNLP
jgi:hypothetical protein